ncbi:MULTISPECIES: hypothetical protein [Glutamicibacter]|uniref:Uncharacterized protein n=1 Tax=Glutamicibacter halophytocola TaxID=1933880 RepID=A0AA95BS50_9MICC|nr:MULTISPECIES: hypothetical protein [Glutamicibacter]MBF6673490.1 hypothetical protein [Glutamicibacter sp. FBE19]UUX59172.1 hypothetical protein NUH22_00560 [Glutamicibacter halophytocola]
MPYIEAIVPTICLALLFWYVMKVITNADRKERQAEAEADALIQNRSDSNNQSNEN